MSIINITPQDVGRKFTTRDGRRGEIMSFHPEDVFPVAANLETSAIPQYYTTDGKFIDQDALSPLDIVSLDPIESSWLPLEVGKKYVNRKGQWVRIIATDRLHRECPVVGFCLADDGDRPFEAVKTFTSSGRFFSAGRSMTMTSSARGSLPRRSLTGP